MQILETKTKVKPVSPMRLCEVDRHAVYHIRSMHLDRKGAEQLEALGLSPGKYIEVLFNDFKGTLALIANDRHIILGRHITYKLKVVPSRRHSVTPAAPHPHREYLPVMDQG